MLVFRYIHGHSVGRQGKGSHFFLRDGGVTFLIRFPEGEGGHQWWVEMKSFSGKGPKMLSSEGVYPTTTYPSLKYVLFSKGECETDTVTVSIKY